MPEIEVPALTIFSQPGCVRCTAAKRFAESREVPYQVIDVAEHPDALNLVQNEWGYKSVPVLYYRGDHVNGFDPGFIEHARDDISEVVAV